MFIYHVWKQAAKETRLSFHVALHDLESLCQDIIKIIKLHTTQVLCNLIILN